MKKIVEYVKEKKWVHYLIIFAIGLLVSIPLINIQITQTHDGSIHLIRLIGLDKSIQESNFPFLVAPYICKNFGYSMTSFYPQIVAYIPYFIGIIANSFNVALKIFAALTISLSGIFMYNLLNETTKNKGIAFLSAVIYMAFPYRFETIYTRFAIGEFTAFVFMPIVFEGLHNLLHGDKKKHFYIAIGAIGLMLSHTISTIIIAMFCGIYILLNIKKFFKKEVILKCLINVIFILIISTLFIIPMLEFKSQSNYAIFQPDILKTAGKYTQKNTIELWQLLKDKGEENGVSFVVGIPTIILFCISILSYKHIDKSRRDIWITNLILGIIAIVMCTKFFPWLYMPQIINNIQYPWRMIGIAMFFFTPVFAINVYYLVNCIKRQKMKNIMYILVIILIGAFTILRLTTYFQKDSTYTSTDNEIEAKLENNLKISHMAINRDYLPVKALVKQFTYLETREDRVYVINGNASIQNENKEGLYLIFDVIDGEQNSELELPYFFYPGYTVTLQYNQNTCTLDTKESDNGFIKITLPDNIKNGTITVEYTGTIIEKISYAISAIALINFIAYIIYYKRETKQRRCK